ncbi:PGBD4-like protein [Mya arenaria]|uniref:PGBD4-like protein n=1 Tax=Mya arenaria TaxID=6604 RepID=A0ABY7F4K5_MYAAR|nr:PGBD4-like protein [Mya arenaria]
MWYTDGVPLFKSSKISIWPLSLSINELPAQERFKQENILSAGLWFGKSKPSMSCFLKPFHDSLNRFRDIGYEINCKHCSSITKVKGVLLCGTCDLPATCMLMNMTQFNGKYGCPQCKQEGEVVFPFDDLIDEPKRNHNEFVQHREEAFASSKPIFVVKGPSWWTNCCSDIINGTAIDYMHSVLLGLVRRLLHLWFDSKFSSHPFSVSHLVNKRLSSIKPPYYIKRHPRDIKEQSKYWKASECRAWLFHYSVPVLFGLLKKNIFQHYLLLVEAIYILNLESISNSDLKHCEELLIKYSCMFSALYGDQHMSANLHQLLHLHDTVEQLGPLWLGEKIGNSAYVIGAKHLKKLDITFAEVIFQSTNFAMGDCYMFYRVMINGTVYHSEKYNTFSRNSCTAIYIIDDFTETPGPNFPDDFDVDHATPLYYFWLVFPFQLITLIVQHTNAFAQWVQARDGFDSFWHETSEAEMRAFLAINVLMGIQQLPLISMYWSSNPFIGNPGIIGTMTCNRFQKLAQYFHVSDRASEPRRGDPGYDRLFKVREVMTAVMDCFKRAYTLSKEVAVDEAMIKYSGRLSFRQYMPNKPI